MVPVMLGVDELLKLNRSSELCSLLDALQQTDPLFHAIVTTLRVYLRAPRSEGDIKAASQQAAVPCTGSGRRVEWVYLPPLSHASTKRLFERFFTSPLPHPETLDLLISDCGGHPRWLEALDWTLSYSRNSAQPHLLRLQSEPEPMAAYATLASHVRESAPAQQFRGVPPFEAVRLAVLGDTVLSDRKVNDSDTVEDCISNGAYEPLFACFCCCVRPLHVLNHFMLLFCVYMVVLCVV